MLETSGEGSMLSFKIRRQPVLLVTHEEQGGAWQFLPRAGACDEIERRAAIKQARLNNLAERRPSPRG